MIRPDVVAMTKLSVADHPIPSSARSSHVAAYDNAALGESENRE
jgi:hypothetical protein